MRRAAWAECAFDRKLTLISFVLHSATQVVSLLSWQTLPLSEKSQRVGSILFAASIWVLPTVAPALYLRWRKEALILYRVGFFAFPLLRKAAGIQAVLNASPQPGIRGVVKDLYKVVWGSRLVAVLMAVMLNPLPLVPLVPQMLLQVYAVAMIRSNNTLCATPLLSAPLTTQRIRRFHSLLHIFSQALPGGVGQSMFPLLLRSGRQREAECESFLTFLFYTVGLLMPMWLLVKTEPPSALRAWERRQGGQALTGRQPPLGRLGTGAEAALRHLCGRSWLAPPQPEEGREWLAAASGATAGAGVAEGRARKRGLRLWGWERAFAWWLLLALLWAVSVAVHSGSHAQQ